MIKKVFILIISLVAVIITLIAAIAFFSYPSYTGTVNINRQGYSNITIRREELGIPHIKGETIFDTIYGLGWV
jgi:acyl-homoserine lactone acylase PvdQ